MKIKLYFLSLLGLILLPASCGRYFSTEIAGYVKDAGREYSGMKVGINDATVKIYLNEPSAAGETGYMAETTTIPSSGQVPGYFSRTIMWYSSSPKYKEEGDSIDIWIAAEHSDFTARLVKVSGIVSDTQNLVPDIELTRVVFTAGTVTGTVTYSSNGVNDARVVLDLTPDNGVDNEDYVTITTTSSETTTPGTFTFLNVKWRNDAPVSISSDTIKIQIRASHETLGSKSISTYLTSGDIPIILNPISLN
ncbi:MAG: hypothetical protein AB1798_00010 [Spirochaetota bacterium]